jgi:hypothetical protein
LWQDAVYGKGRGTPRKDATMDYGKSGNPKGGRHEPRNAYDQQQSGPKGFGRKDADKAALLAKMKANAEKAQKAGK